MEGTTMIWLSGHVSPQLAVAIAAGRRDLGFMLTPNMRNRLPDAPACWAADAGTYTSTREFDADRYLDWLYARRHAAERCLFATLPDVVGDGVETAHWALPCLTETRGLGYRVAWVLQPGVEASALPWHLLDAVFLGGPDGWQQSRAAHQLVAEARRRGLWTHRGRVNSRRRLLATTALGFDSADGTCLAFGPTVRLPEVCAWVREANRQASLWNADALVA
jgi:hypothetical protein